MAGFLVLGGLEAWRDAPTYDEPVYVAAGLAALHDADLDVNPEHPPLFKVIAALPVGWADAAPLSRSVLAPAAGTPSPTAEHAWSARVTSAQLARGRLRAVTFASRGVDLLLTAILAIALFGFGRQLWRGSAWAGLLAALLWLASPLTLGFGHLDGIDVGFSLAVVAFCAALWRWLRSPTWGATLGLGAACGLAALADADGLALVLYGLAVVGWRSWRGAGSGGAGMRGRGTGTGGAVRVAVGRVAVTALIGWLVLWLPYVVLDPASVGLRLVPAAYAEGIRFLSANDASAQAGFLLGRHWDGGRWWFWPLSLAVKLAPSTVVLLLLAPLGWRGSGPVFRRPAALAVAGPALILVAFCLTMNRDTSVRYLLPVLALAGLGCGGLVHRAGRTRGGASRRGVPRIGVGLLAVAAGLSVACTVGSFPDSLAWSDPVFGPSYRVADNADLDWGQDFYALKDWLTRHPHARVAYFGPQGLVDAVRAAGARPLAGVPRTQVSGWLAVSATEVDSVPSLAWLAGRRPRQVIDGTLLIYRISAAAVPGRSSVMTPLTRGSASHARSAARSGQKSHR